MKAAGFVYQDVFGVDLFLDGPEAHPRCRGHVIFGGEKVRPHYDAPRRIQVNRTVSPGLAHAGEWTRSAVKLASFRLKDRVHLVDLIEIGLIGEKTSPACRQTRREAEELLENPEGSFSAAGGQ